MSEPSQCQSSQCERIAAENAQMRTLLRLIAFGNFEPIEGTRSGHVMLTIQEMRSIRQAVGATPLIAEQREVKP